MTILLRRAGAEDARLLLDWRNDPETRRHSFDPAAVRWDDHARWLERKLSDPGARLWIAEAGGEPVGQIRVERARPGLGEVHLSVAPDARGRGHSPRMIDAAAREGAGELGLRRLVGRVKADNAASRRAFESAGFALADPPVHEAVAPPEGALLFARDLVAAPVVAIVQARMGSTRLPGKALAEVGGRPLLAHMLDRVAYAGTIDAAWVATTHERRDDPITELAEASGHAVFRGPEHDVLARFAGAAEAAGAATVVRLTADCPLITPDAIDLVVGALAASDADLATNAPPLGRTWPDGVDAEAFTSAALQRAHAEATDPADREHVTRWFHGHARVEVVHHDPPLGDVRITVDTPEDLERVRGVLEAGPAGGPEATLDDLLAAL